jgi:hypothetical protein
MNRFSERCIDISTEAQKYIMANIGNGLTFKEDPDEYPDDWQEQMYALPNVGYVTKHGHYIDMAILGIYPETAGFVMKVYELGEGSDYDMIPSYHLATMDYCVLADYIELFLKQT